MNLSLRQFRSVNLVKRHRGAAACGSKHGASMSAEGGSSRRAGRPRLALTAPAGRSSRSSTLCYWLLQVTHQSAVTSIYPFMPAGALAIALHSPSGCRWDRSAARARPSCWATKATAPAPRWPGARAQLRPPAVAPGGGTSRAMAPESPAGGTGVRPMWIVSRLTSHSAEPSIIRPQHPPQMDSSSGPGVAESLRQTRPGNDQQPRQAHADPHGEENAPSSGRVRHAAPPTRRYCRGTARYSRASPAVAKALPKWPH